MSYRTLVAHTSGSARIVELHRPDKRNALSRELLSELATELEACDREPGVRGVVICGSADVFSAGADLTEAVAATEPEAVLEYLTMLRGAGARLETLSKPVVAAIRGVCLTGGLELAMACDFRVAAHGATMGINSARIGSLPAMGGTQLLPRIIGAARAKDLLFTARLIGAEEALSIGLVDRVCEPEETVECAVAWVRACAAQSPLSVRLAKYAVNTGLKMDLGGGLDLEAALAAVAFASPDKNDGMRAFLEKREPTWAHNQPPVNLDRLGR